MTKSNVRFVANPLKDIVYLCGHPVYGYTNSKSRLGSDVHNKFFPMQRKCKRCQVGGPKEEVVMREAHTLKNGQTDASVYFFLCILCYSLAFKTRMRKGTDTAHQQRRTYAVGVLWVCGVKVYARWMEATRQGRTQYIHSWVRRNFKVESLCGVRRDGYYSLLAGMVHHINRLSSAATSQKENIQNIYLMPWVFSLSSEFAFFFLFFCFFFRCLGCALCQDVLEGSSCLFRRHVFRRNLFFYFALPAS